MSVSKVAHTDMDFDVRDARALTRPMDVYADDPDAWGDSEVAVYHEGRQHIVSVAAGFCDCGDAHYRNVECQHIKRVKYTLGICDIPEWCDRDRLDETLVRQRAEIDDSDMRFMEVENDE
jgi:hypothetical protein